MTSTRLRLLSASAIFAGVTTVAFGLTDWPGGGGAPLPTATSLPVAAPLPAVPVKPVGPQADGAATDGDRGAVQQGTSLPSVSAPRAITAGSTVPAAPRPLGSGAAATPTATAITPSPTPTGTGSPEASPTKASVGPPISLNVVEGDLCFESGRKGFNADINADNDLLICSSSSTDETLRWRSSNQPDAPPPS